MANEMVSCEFDGGRVVVDGISFKNCKFEGSILVYSGGQAPMFDSCKFNSTQWALTGEAANTLGFLKGLYTSPFRPVVEQMILHIQGKMKIKDENE